MNVLKIKLNNVYAIKRINIYKNDLTFQIQIQRLKNEKHIEVTK